MARTSGIEPPSGERPRPGDTGRPTSNIGSGNVIERSSLQPADTPARDSGDSLAEDRREAIARAAYYRAEQRGFEPGHELEDWLEAERVLTQSEEGRDDFR